MSTAGIVDTELAMRRLLVALQKRAAATASLALDGVTDTIDGAVDSGVAEHSAKTSGVHGVTPGTWVAKTSHESQFPNWSDIRNKPDFLAGPTDPPPDDDDHLTPFIALDWLPVAGPGEIADDKLVRADDPRLSVEPQMIRTGEGMGAGMYVCVYNDAGTTRVQRADASDTSHAAVAYIIDSVGVNEDAAVYFAGVNTSAQLMTTPTLADVGKTVFLATTPGYVSLTPPSAPGQLLMPLGRIIRIVSLTTIQVLTIFETQFYL